MRQRLRARFRAWVAVQAMLLVLAIGVLAWTVLNTSHVALPLTLGLVIAGQIALLLASVESHVEALEEFFAAVNYEDLTLRFSTDNVDGELKSQFNRILERFADARARRDGQASYLDTVVRHVPVPFFAERADGSLSLVNNPARRLTGLSALSRLDDLAELDPELPAKMRQIAPGQQELIQTRLREVPVELRISVSQIRLEGENERLYSVENLSGELTARESSAWRNLLRVLTHEIMNTLTPVTSLADTCSEMLQKSGADDDVREAVDTIARRSEGLLTFVARYRELMQLPKPRKADMPVSELISAAVTLMRDELHELAVRVDVIPETLSVRVDRALMDQVLINLLRNALDATADVDEPRITIRARLDHGRVLLQVEDNGPGIPEHLLDQLFVPFFTTKRDGSGIGLSVSRQIMSAHGGEIAVRSAPGKTVFSLVLP